MWIGILNTSVTVPSLPGQGNPGPPPPASKFAALETNLTDLILLETSSGTNNRLLLETQT